MKAKDVIDISTTISELPKTAFDVLTVLTVGGGSFMLVVGVGFYLIRRGGSQS